MDAVIVAALREANQESPFYTEDELRFKGAKHVGQYCQISRLVTFYGFRGSFGDFVRIDDWCVIKGDVSFLDYVHISSFSCISGIRAPVIIREFVGIASHLNLLSGTDDYRSNTLGNPCTPHEYVTMINGPIDIGIGTVIGSHCLILPNVTIGDGSSIGAGCIINFNVPKGGMVRPPKSILLNKRRDVNRIKEMALRIYEERDGGTC